MMLSPINLLRCIQWGVEAEAVPENGVKVDVYRPEKKLAPAA